MSSLHVGFLFIAAGAVVVGAATSLARYADVIALRTRMGRLWVGAVVLATATSLPELGTDVAAVRLGAANLAVGDLFGSSMANMLILALVDLLHPRRSVLRQATLDHALSASLALCLNAFATIFILWPSDILLGWVSPESLVLASVYVVGTRAVYRHAVREALAASEPPGQAVPSLRRAVLNFAVAAAIILLAAPVFAFAAKRVAELTGLGHTFMGTWLVGFSTSLPELVASLAAVRLGAFDLAIGNLFGSNAFNMSVFVWLDLASPEGSIFALADKVHALSGLFAVTLMALGVAAIVYRAKKRFAMLEPDSALIVLVYVLGLWMLYANRGAG